MEKITPAQLNSLIRSRRSVFPEQYRRQEISRELLEEVLENANWAPTHRLTEPWRFKIFQGNALKDLSDYLADYYEKHTPAEKFSPIKLKKTRQKPLQSAAVIAICMQRDPQERVPEWEEIAAVACAVQNMWLTCTAHGIGSYWSSPEAMLAADHWLELKEGERCLGLFYMGYYDDPGQQGKRGPIMQKVEWK